MRKLVRKRQRKEGTAKEGSADADGDHDDELTSPVLDKPGQGLQTLTWNLRLAGVKRMPKMVLWGAELGGPRAAPGEYRAVLRVGEARHRRRSGAPS